MRKTRQGIQALFRRHLNHLVGYTPIMPAEVLAEEAGKTGNILPGVIKLDGNENPYGPSPRVQKALAERGLYHQYPDPAQRYLRAALAGYVGVGSEHIVVGNGSDEILELVVKLLLEPGEKAINCVPTFGMYRFVTGIAGGIDVQVERKGDYSLDIEAIESAIDEKTKIIWVASPNNPTGNVLPREDLHRLLDSGLAVVVDEAYYEFCGMTVVPLIANYDNLMVIRTFSKWAALAGVRLGYGIVAPEVAACMARIKQPYNLSIFAQTAGLKSLEDREYLMGNVRAITREKERLFSRLEKFCFLRPIPSQANFILCEVVQGGAEKLYQRLRDLGIYIRYFDNQWLRNFVRITVGKPEHTDALVDALGVIEGELGE